METLHFLTGNIKGGAEVTYLHGRKYLVTNATLIVPGVLNGSRGPLYYPPEEVGKDPSIWNGMPLVLYHPTINGEPTTARDPDILEAQGLGFVFRTHFTKNRLRAQLYFDEALTANHDRKLPEEHRILPRLHKGEPIECSTGVFTQDEPAHNGANHNGIAYNATARNYKSDHLAVLPDMVGACSVKDGCGISVKHNAEKDDDKKGEKAGSGFQSDEQRRAFFARMASGKIAGGKRAKDAIKATVSNPLSSSGSGRQERAAATVADLLASRMGAKVRTPEAVRQAALTHYHKSSGFRRFFQSPEQAADAVRDAFKKAPNKQYTNKPMPVRGKVNFDMPLNHGMTGNAMKGQKCDCSDCKAKRRKKRAQKMNAQTITTNQASHTGDDMNKAQKVQWLATNCDCWKNSKATLETMDEATLDSLIKREKDDQQLRANLAKPVTVNGQSFTFNAQTGQLDPVAPTAVVPTGNASAPKALDYASWIAAAPPEGQAALNYAGRILKRERTNLISRIVASKPESERQALAANLAAQSDETLELLASLVPSASQQAQNYDPLGIINREPPTDYSGNMGAPPTGNAAGDEIPALGLPVINSWGQKEDGPVHPNLVKKPA